MNFNSSIFALLLVGLPTFFPSADAVAVAVADNNYESSAATKLAVVRPFSPADVVSLYPSFDVWDKYPPCSANGTVADLFLVYSQSLETSPQAQEAVGRVTDRFHENNGWGHCFGEIFSIDANIQADLDIYQPKQQDTNPLWVNGPNRHFERIIRVGQAEGYDTLYLMEGDSVPVKASWLDSLMLDAELKRPFAIFGSTFKGDKWDAFYPELPKALTSHLNGNAIYNLTSKALNDVIDLLEDENGGSIPYDYRISQHALSNGFYSDLKETKLIANYAATNILPKHITADAAIVHGANIYEGWNDHDEDLTLVVSAWENPDATSILSHLEDGDHPFSSVVLMLPPGGDLPVLDEDRMPSIPINAYHRTDDEMSYMDLCTAPVTTKFFMMTNSYHRVRPNIALMRTADGKPVISFAPANDEYCFKFPSCKESIEQARYYHYDHNKVVQDFDMVFTTKHRDELCNSWLETYGVDGRRLQSAPAVPSATAYTAYIESQGLADDMYSFSDVTLYGVRPAFVRVPTQANAKGSSRRLAESSAVNSTGCALEVTEDDCLSSTLECEWRPVFDSCHGSPTTDSTNTAYYFLSMDLDGVGLLSTDEMIMWQDSTSLHIANHYALDNGADDVETVVTSQSVTEQQSGTRRSLADATNTITYKQRFVSEAAASKAKEASPTTDGTVQDILVSPFNSEDDAASYVVLLQDSPSNTDGTNAFSTMESISTIEIVGQPGSVETALTPRTSTASRSRAVVGLVAGIVGGFVLVTILLALFLWHRRHRQTNSASVNEFGSDGISTNEVNGGGADGEQHDSTLNAYDDGSDEGDGPMADVPVEP